MPDELITPNRHSPDGTTLSSHEASEETWQRQMLPLMAKMVLGLTVFFFVVSLVQLTYLHLSIRSALALDLGVAFSGLTDVESFEKQFQIARFRALAELDLSAMDRRHHQANVLLMARVWTRYIGFVTGMILAMIGAVFILGKLRTSPSQLAANISGTGEVTLTSASPGLVMIVLGVVLMISTIAIHHPITVNDRATYIELSSPVQETSVKAKRKGKPSIPTREQLLKKHPSLTAPDNQLGSETQPRKTQ